jgi:prepilin-type N-terminal cleavage/methylation domain-containing protein
MSHEPLTTRNPQLATPQRKAFTLIEMLVVISVIVLAMTLAIPAIRSLTGSRSEQTAQNTLSSLMGFARSEAVGLQKVEGVMFFLDTTNDRVSAAIVREVPVDIVNEASNVTYLDLVKDHDPLLLPNGIRIWTLKDGPAIGTTDAFPQWRYLGFNAYPTGPKPATMTVIPGGVILFDGSGKLTVRQYGLRLAPPGGANPITDLGRYVYTGNQDMATITQRDWPSPFAQASQQFLLSQIGLVILDHETFAAQGFGDDNGNDANGSTQVAVHTWLDSNTTPIFVNRYDASLMRAE